MSLRVRSPANTIVVKNPSITSNGQTLNEDSMDNNSNSGVVALLTTTTMMDQGQIQHGGRFGTPDVNQHLQQQQHQQMQQHQQQMMSSQQCFDSNGNSYQMQDTAQCVPAQQDLFAKLHESLSLEPKYQPNLFLPQQSNVSLINLFIFFWYF